MDRQVVGSKGVKLPFSIQWGRQRKAPKTSRAKAPYAVAPGCLLEKTTCLRLDLEKSLHIVNKRKLRRDGSKYTVNSNSGLLPAHSPAETAPFIDIKIMCPTVRTSRHLAGAELLTLN